MGADPGHFNAGDPTRGKDDIFDDVERQVRAEGRQDDGCWGPVLTEMHAARRGEAGHDGLVRALASMESMIVDGQLYEIDAWEELLARVRVELAALKRLAA